MKTILAVALTLLAVPAYAGCLVPPPEYDHVPRTPVSVSFDKPEVIAWEAEGLGLGKARGYEIGYDTGKIVVRLSLGTSLEEECRIRHANGHINEWEATGNPDSNHDGWKID